MFSWKSKLFTWILAFLIPIFLIIPILTNPVEEHAEDAAYLHIYRSIVFSAATSDGWLVPRWVPQLNAGLGSPIFNFYSPGVYYALNIIHLLGFSQPIAWRVLSALIVLIASLGSFALALVLFKKAYLAVLCATIYTYSPYLQQDLLQRGSPEALAICLVPWMLLGLLLLARKHSGLHFVFASFGWAALILAHNLSAIISIPLICIIIGYITICSGRKQLYLVLASLVAGTLLASFHIIPFIVEKQYINFSNVTKAIWAQPIDQSLTFSEFMPLPIVLDIGLSNNSIFAARVGIPQFLALILSLISLPILWHRKQWKEVYLLCGSVGLVAILIWLQTSSATWVWKLLPQMQVIQFRWRLLSLVALPTGLSLSILMSILAKRVNRILVPIVSILFVIVQIPSIYPQLLPFVNHVDSNTTAKDVTLIAYKNSSPDLTATGEFLPRWREWPFSDEETKWVALTPVANLPAGSRLISDERGTGWIKASIETPVSFSCSMHLLYYPGWIAYVDNQRQVPRPSVGGGGYATVDVGAGTHTIEFRYEGTWDQHLGDILSVVTLIVLVSSTFLWRVRTQPLHSSIVYYKPIWVVPLIILVCASLKTFYIDRQTTWFRYNSKVGAIAGASNLTDVAFDDTIRLVGYTITNNVVEPGNTLHVTLFWMPDQPMSDPHANSYIHLLGTVLNNQAGDYLWGQQDKQEVPGAWASGKIFRDSFDIPVSLDAPPGPYSLEIGWWLPSTSKQLVVHIVSPNDDISETDTGYLVLSGITVR